MPCCIWLKKGLVACGNHAEDMRPFLWLEVVVGVFWPLSVVGHLTKVGMLFPDHRTGISDGRMQESFLEYRVRFLPTTCIPISSNICVPPDGCRRHRRHRHNRHAAPAELRAHLWRSERNSRVSHVHLLPSFRGVRAREG